MNDFALYYTARKEVGQANSYRNIRGSVPFKSVVEEKEASNIASGAEKCCKRLEKNIMFFKKPESESIKDVKELPSEFKTTVDRFCKDDERVMRTMVCLQVNYEFGGTDRKLAICS